MKQIVFGKSVRGASHIRSERSCQDSYRKMLLDDGTIILAVADGHGSRNCPYSKTGSQIAVNVFCDTLKSLYESYSGMPEQLPTYLNREGDIGVPKDIDAEWKRRVIENHKKKKREIGKRKDGGDDLSSVYKQYGTTLLGLMVTDTFLFALQLGDGDICYVNQDGLDMVIEPEKILGVETHSLSRERSWEKAISTVRMIQVREQLPALFTLSTDGYANSYKTEEEFHAAVADYLGMLTEHGVKAVEKALPGWLSETSELGCGDDITMLIAYFMPDEEEMPETVNVPEGESEGSADA